MTIHVFVKGSHLVVATAIQFAIIVSVEIIKILLNLHFHMKIIQVLIHERQLIGGEVTEL
jgi:hypothetical protein